MALDPPVYLSCATGRLECVISGCDPNRFGAEPIALPPVKPTIVTTHRNTQPRHETAFDPEPYLLCESWPRLNGIALRSVR